MTTPEQPFQFSLRTVLLLLGGAALFLGMFRSPVVAAIGVGLICLFHLAVMWLVRTRVEEVDPLHFEVVAFGWLMFLPFATAITTPALGCLSVALALLWVQIGPFWFVRVIATSRPVFVTYPDLRAPFLMSCGAMFVSQGWALYWGLIAFLQWLPTG